MLKDTAAIILNGSTTKILYLAVKHHSRGGFLLHKCSLCLYYPIRAILILLPAKSLPTHVMLTRSMGNSIYQLGVRGVIIAL